MMVFSSNFLKVKNFRIFFYNIESDPKTTNFGEWSQYESEYGLVSRDYNFVPWECKSAHKI